MPGHGEHRNDRGDPQAGQDFPRVLFLGTVLQFALRTVLVVFIAVTLLPNR